MFGKPTCVTLTTILPIPYVIGDTDTIKIVGKSHHSCFQREVQFLMRQDTHHKSTSSHMYGLCNRTGHLMSIDESFQFTTIDGVCARGKKN